MIAKGMTRKECQDFCWGLLFIVSVLGVLTLGTIEVVKRVRHRTPDVTMSNIPTAAEMQRTAEAEQVRISLKTLDDLNKRIADDIQGASKLGYTQTMTPTNFIDKDLVDEAIHVLNSKGYTVRVPKDSPRFYEFILIYWERK